MWGKLNWEFQSHDKMIKYVSGISKCNQSIDMSGPTDLLDTDQKVRNRLYKNFLVKNTM